MTLPPTLGILTIDLSIALLTYRDMDVYSTTKPWMLQSLEIWANHPTLRKIKMSELKHGNALRAWAEDEALRQSYLEVGIDLVFILSGDAPLSDRDGRGMVEIPDSIFGQLKTPESDDGNPESDDGLSTSSVIPDINDEKLPWSAKHESFRSRVLKKIREEHHLQ
jgi:hypothetical protein